MIRMDAAVYKDRLSGFDYVSFDLFDTLVFRTVFFPVDVFDLVAEQFSRKEGGSNLDFPLQRRKAEEAARKKVFPKEIDLDAIYRELPCSESAKERLKALEKETEIRCSVPNVEMVRLLEWCQKLGKRIIITTDMYLDRVTIDRLLRHCGISYDELFISGEVGVTKYSGELFPYVLGELGIDGNRLAHIGDNPQSDIAKPAAYGVYTLLYEAHPIVCTDYMKTAVRHSAIDRHNIALIFRGLQNSPNQSEAFRLGFSVLGPFLLEFCQWLHGMKSLKELDRLVFLAREGFFLKQCYERIYPDDRESIRYVRLNKKVLTSAEKRPDLLRRYLEQEGLMSCRTGLVNNSINGTGQYLLEGFIRREGWEMSPFGLQIIHLETCKKRLGQRFASFMEESGLPAFYKYEFHRCALVLEHLLFEPEGTALMLVSGEDGVNVICDNRGI